MFHRWEGNWVGGSKGPRGGWGYSARQGKRGYDRPSLNRLGLTLSWMLGPMTENRGDGMENAHIVPDGLRGSSSQNTSAS